MSKTKTILLPLLTALLLAGCTATHPPDYQGLPSRDSIQAGEEITVTAGENVYAIARKYGVSMRAIIVLNDLKPPFALKAGQQLTLPLKEGVAPNTPNAAPRGSIEAAPLAPFNSPVTSAPLSPPASGAVSEGPLAPRAAPAPVETTVAKSKTTAASNAAPVRLAPAAPESAPKAVESSEKIDTSGFTVQPPVQGPIIASFGSGNDGLNIGAPKGSAVVAAAGGIVVYAGNEMKGFGNLILIRHEEGWVTAYGHLDRMLVSKDGIVAAGDQIGTVGTSGGVSAPQLHFEVRQNSKPIDPKIVMKQAD